MANLNLNTVELVSTLRAAPMNGSPSSQDYNDSWTEALADLSSLAGFIDDILIPMLDGLSSNIMPNPNGATSGLEGKYIFGDTSDLTSLFFDSLSDEPLSVADSLRVLQGMVQTGQTSINTLTTQVIALQSIISSTNQNDIAQALQNFSAALSNLTSQTVANTQAIASISPVLLMAATTLTVAELLALPTPVILIPTAGPNTVIVPQLIFMQYKYNTTAYTIANADNTFYFQWATGQSADVSIYATGLVDQSANAIAYTSATDIGSPALATQAVNSSFEVILTGTSPALTLGNGSLIITISYYVITLQ